ncbi:unnamed protein product [Caenorhabditis auriculariae]|uniref:N-acetyltransferase domain-containing protein n=1 Tax=Caenorhabditis auriculariae TaxID=2777116 RepID=A0A8S1HL97_9PELO|nr:unnamed protein product [Caenorhabditis auriculariae]
MLNEEWPRSVGARFHSQKRSCREAPPMSFLLLDDETGRLIGHARLCLLPNRSKACWIESVLIRKSFRGRGLGKLVMRRLEDWMRDKNFDEAFLSTDDQIVFYRSCGYEDCQPIVHSTAATSVFPIMSKIEIPLQAEHADSRTLEKSKVCKNGNVPPPPPPPPNTAIKSAVVATVHHQYMRKKLENVLK